MDVEQLMKEVERLRHKLSPLEDKEFTRVLAGLMGGEDLGRFEKKFRKSRYIVVTPREIAEVCGLPQELHVLTNIGRSLQAMCWERSAINGTLVFVMPVEEYNAGLQ